MKPKAFKRNCGIDRYIYILQSVNKEENERVYKGIRFSYDKYAEKENWQDPFAGYNVCSFYITEWDWKQMLPSLEPMQIESCVY